MATRRRRRRPPPLARLSSFSDSDVLTPFSGRAANRRRRLASSRIDSVSNSAVRKYTTKAAEEIRRRRARELAEKRKQADRAAKAAKSSSLAYVAMKTWTVTKVVVIMALLVRLAIRNPYVAKILQFAWRKGKLVFTKKDEPPAPQAVQEVASVLGFAFGTPIRILLSAGVLGVAYLVISAAVRKLRAILETRLPAYRCGVNIANMLLTRSTKRNIGIGDDQVFITEQTLPPEIFQATYGLLSVQAFDKTFENTEFVSELMRYVTVSRKGLVKGSSPSQQTENDSKRAPGLDDQDADPEREELGGETKVPSQRSAEFKKREYLNTKFRFITYLSSTSFHVILRISGGRNGAANQQNEQKASDIIIVKADVAKTYEATVQNIISAFCDTLTITSLKQAQLLSAILPNQDNADNEEYYNVLGRIAQAKTRSARQSRLQALGLGFSVVPVEFAGRESVRTV